MSAPLPGTFRIGALELRARGVLAPMAGFTDYVFRSLCLRHGAGLVFTELISAAGIVYDSRQTLSLLDTAPGEHPVVAHLYGSEPSVMAEAARRVAALNRFVSIDVNAGCPVRRIVAKGAGAALMGDPERMGAIVRAIKTAVPLPVTVKTRLGLAPDRRNIVEVLRAVEQGGADGICVHARVASSRHAGAADWEGLGAVKAESRIPVIGNGGVRKAADAVAMIRQTGVDAVMVGRGALGNPWLFAAIAAALDGGETAPPSPAERRAVITEHLAGLVDLQMRHLKHRHMTRPAAERRATLYFRPHLLNYLHGMDGWTRVRRQLNTMCSVAQVEDALDAVLGEA